nr:hypothetical protein Iba_chr04aCG11890 [Ipomoea batatas]GME12254.1 hypothetical protein Iba_scaffold13512CG0030 [Ipomoea batatas]
MPRVVLPPAAILIAVSSILILKILINIEVIALHCGLYNYLPQLSATAVYAGRSSSTCRNSDSCEFYTDSEVVIALHCCLYNYLPQNCLPHWYMPRGVLPPAAIFIAVSSIEIQKINTSTYQGVFPSYIKFDVYGLRTASEAAAGRSYRLRAVWFCVNAAAVVDGVTGSTDLLGGCGELVTVAAAVPGVTMECPQMPPTITTVEWCCSLPRASLPDGKRK